MSGNIRTEDNRRKADIDYSCLPTILKNYIQYFLENRRLLRNNFKQVLKVLFKPERKFWKAQANTIQVAVEGRDERGGCFGWLKSALICGNTSQDDQTLEKCFATSSREHRPEISMYGWSRRDADSYTPQAFHSVEQAPEVQSSLASDAT